MSFDIARTPTLEAVATEDERLLAQDLHKRVEESIGLAEAQPEVAEAAEAHRVAEERHAGLRKAERTLSQHAKDLREQAAVNAQAAIGSLVESASSGDKPDFRKLQGLAAIENQSAFATRAIQRIVEHLIPLAKIAALRAESHAAMARARAVERIAQERAEKVLGQMRDAVTEEMVLPVDLSKGVAGALLAHAAGLKRMAIQISENADELERSYGERRGR
jgi:hypothetical protein